MESAPLQDLRMEFAPPQDYRMESSPSQNYRMASAPIGDDRYLAESPMMVNDYYPRSVSRVRKFYLDQKCWSETKRCKGVCSPFVGSYLFWGTTRVRINCPSSATGNCVARVSGGLPTVILTVPPGGSKYTEGKWGGAMYYICNMGNVPFNVVTN